MCFLVCSCTCKQILKKKKQQKKRRWQFCRSNVNTDQNVRKYNTLPEHMLSIYFIEFLRVYYGYSLVGVLRLKARLKSIYNICSNKTPAVNSHRVSPPKPAFDKGHVILYVHMCSLSYWSTWEMLENRLPNVGGRRQDGGLSNKAQMKLF